MPTTLALKISAVLYLILIVFEGSRTRSLKRFSLELLPLLALILLDVWIATASAGYVTFGATAPLGYGILLAMFLAILCGTAARYIFFLKGKFNWLDFLKPLCISPLLLLPLMGSLQSVKELEPMQTVSFALLAFQNGFFWQLVLQRNAPKK